jgi:hypothetical protein
MADNSKLSKPGLIPLKVENQGSLITTQINKINFSGSGVTASVGQFNDIIISIDGGGGSGGGVTQIIAGTNISISPVGGTGAVTINASSTTVSASYALSSSYALTSSYASTSTSASYAATSSYAKNIIISGSINNVDYIDFNTGSATPAWKSGRVFWDNTDGALSVYNAEQDITLQVGQENWTRVSNRTGATILNGTVVRLLGAHGDVPEVELAQSLLISGSVNLQNQILGVATHNIEDNSKGYITTQGLVRGLNTNAFNDGDTLFVGTGSAGVLQNTSPVAPYEIIPVGVCVKASPGTSGIIYVAVQEPLDFSDLSSVLVTGSYSIGDIWTYILSGSTGVWTHTNQLSGSYGITGSLRTTGSIISTFVTASSLTGSFTGSLIGTASYAADFNKTGLITTGSFGTTQIISGSLTLGNTTSTTNDNITITGTSAGGGVAFISASKFLKIGATLDLTLESPSGIYTNAPYVLVGDSTGGTTDVEIYGSTAITAQTPLFTVNADSTVMNGALEVTGGITGSLFGTASYVENIPSLQQVTDTGYTTTNPITSAGFNSTEISNITYFDDIEEDGLLLDNINAGADSTVNLGLGASTEYLGGLKAIPSTYAASAKRNLVSLVSYGQNRIGIIANYDSSGTAQDIIFSNYGTYITPQLQIKGSTSNILVNTNTDTGEKFQASGSSKFNGNLTITGSSTNSLLVKGSGTTSATSTLLVQDSSANSSLEVLDDNVTTVGRFSGFSNSATTLRIGHKTSNQYATNLVLDPNKDDNTYYKVVMQANYSSAQPFQLYSNGVQTWLYGYGNPMFATDPAMKIPAQISMGTTDIGKSEISGSVLFIHGENYYAQAAYVRYTSLSTGVATLRGAVTGLWTGNAFRVWNYENTSIDLGVNNVRRLQVTPSGINVTGSLVAPSITGSLQGTASYATTANYAASTPTVPSTLFVQGYLTSNQSIPNNTDTIIDFERQYDPNLWLDIGTRRFTPTIAGYYLVTFGTWLENPASPTNQVNMQIRKSTGGGPPGTVMIVQQPLNNGTGISLTGTRIYYMDGATDYLDFTIFQGSGAPKDLLYGGTPDGSGTWFSAHLITM